MIFQEEMPQRPNKVKAKVDPLVPDLDFCLIDEHIEYKFRHEALHVPGHNELSSEVY